MNFKQALEIYDSKFESILEILKLRREPEEVDAIRNLLKATNLILEYFMDREESDLKIPIVYFPLCSDYAQEICEDFVTIKLGLYSNKDWKNRICTQLSKGALVVPQGVKTQRQKRLLADNHTYELKLSSILYFSKNEYTDYGRSLIYSERLQREHDSYLEAVKRNNRGNQSRYWYLCHAVNDSKDFLKGYCPLSLIHNDYMYSDDSVDSPGEAFYNHFFDNEENLQIQNIVVFPFGSADGRYSSFCSEFFQKPYLDDVASEGCGLKNVFFFCFSRKPYRLRRLFDFKQRMKERLQLTNDEAYDFISFTHNEALILSQGKGTKHRKIYLGREHNDLQEDFETLFDDITIGLDRNVSRRNEMALCINEYYQRDYYEKLLDETEADENILSQIFDFNSRLWKEQIEERLDRFVSNQSVYVITGFDVDDMVKSNFAEYLKDECNANNVSFGYFQDLRGYLINGVYQNRILEKRILVVSFRNDYTNSIFHKYPNSFDPFCVNSDQSLMEILNYYCLRQYYDWGWYNYTNQEKKILKSVFRGSEMKPSFTQCKKPVNRLPEDVHELEEDRNVNRKVQKIKVIYKGDDRQQELYKSELMLFKVGDLVKISPLSDLLDLYESVDGLSVQPLSPLVRRIFTQCIEEERDIDNRSERMFKEQPVYGLDADEIASENQLWKILLAKRVDEFGSKEVYDSIMDNFDERYKISYHSFKRWTDPEYGIPRSKKVQKFLIEEYLGIRPPYINLIRRIKERTKSDTGEITLSIKNFLNIALLNPNYSAVFKSLSDETRDLLGLEGPADVEKIITDVKEKIKLESVKEICYDNN